ncbi:ectoine/hydroxyectoine ABC transporter permease subunit EhuD [Streptomyces sp. SID3343]|uniref:ectoine/hydroxyectoine ABC transporter permease subunit EhuD n=1 Tax=Streptomyces sp. SID3343 TaxID=2690260 RepID=UPI00136CA5AC|nr:ectoine/hydroxyectoine ABC transporter permease subunit EhuD [Streptomyces sp. SID3343]MYV98189.1 ectoine/hydroxyectoine ABC transporter permease subunit EhuD [Streptomyces sp. SID3343]
MSWDWQYAWDIVPDLWDGMLVALQATLYGYVLALVLGLGLALLRRSPSRWVSLPVALISELIRSTPLLVQLFFMFYVLPTIGITWEPLTVGALTLGIHYATYTSEVYRSGIEGVPVGQWEAATALNLPRRRVWTSVILPQAVPRVVPALGNYLISMFKDTPQLIAITVVEVFSTARELNTETFRTLEPFTVAGVFYLVIALVMSGLLRLVERRFGRVRG